MHATREEAQKANLSFDLVDYAKPMLDTWPFELVGEELAHKKVVCPKISRIQKNEERQQAQTQIETSGVSYKPRRLEIINVSSPAGAFVNAAQSITVKYKHGHSNRRAKLRYVPEAIADLNFMALHMLETSLTERLAQCGLGNVQAVPTVIDNENFMLVKAARPTGSGLERAWSAAGNLTLALINPFARLLIPDLPTSRKEEYLYIPRDTFECLFERNGVVSKSKKFTSEHPKP